MLEVFKPNTISGGGEVGGGGDGNTPDVQTYILF